MRNKVTAIVAREIREALPAFVFFLFLFHMIGLTKAVLLEDYSLTALRATTSTIGALIVAKAILVVEALPIAGWFSGRRAVQILWKTVLFATVAILFRFAEEIIPLMSQHGSSVAAIQAMLREIAWPRFWVLALWILGGLVLYCLASELTRMVGPERVKEMLLASSSPE